MRKILITGSSGFIGFHLSKKFLDFGYSVSGIDNMNNYYSKQLKEDRNSILKRHENYVFFKSDINDSEALHNILSQEKPDLVVHLAAQAGVRYSIDNPHVFVRDNIGGFVTLLEACNKNQIKNLLYASSSSVYGNANKFPISEDNVTDKPLSLYGASKKCNEILAYVYNNLFNFNSIGLRFFTVYGPWGRPDMALYKFADCIREGRPLPVYNKGNHERSFTYIDDITDSIFRLSDTYFFNSKEKNSINKIFNIGGAYPTKLMDYINVLEKYMGKEAIIELLPFQIGDVKKTDADISYLESEINFKPKTTIEDGVRSFVDWYKSYYEYKT